MKAPKITLLAGGVGGAKAAEGLAKSRYADTLSIIGNIGDDQPFYGLWVSPDIDTLTYTLADEIHREQGWGIKDESHRIQNRLKQFGLDTWMQLGDIDFATHLFRTEQRSQGIRPQKIAENIARSLNVTIPIYLPTDDIVPTRLKTAVGELDFQDYFVAKRCQPKVSEVIYTKAHEAKPTPEAISAIQDADIIIIAPSNPLLSIGAILAIPGIKKAIQESNATVIAISPLIGDKAIKGPAAKLLKELGMPANAIGIAHFYQDLIDVLLIDSSDAHMEKDIRALGIGVSCQPILMKNEKEKTEVMEQTVDIARSLLQFNRRCA
ncbi:2-phospho-L-lactate transferase [Vibrio salinus]|uniref:2-phospho-L-lactate transferase n=1 Tax=Vibrio salinus TaxID=2899784 RepID=UPI001E43BC54|nr:2-phospho-L-lactate transferase [Vibrio salinus]MCE0493694.1 2-phospho-L-lactate transferase [Vibrio salinus]